MRKISLHLILTEPRARQLIDNVPDMQYLVADYLAEVTMCILARAKNQKSKSKGAGEGGYVKEFLDTVYKPLMKPILSRGIKIVTNAGGMNPVALKLAIEECTKAANLPVPIVAAVYGDDILHKSEDLLSSNKFKHFVVDGVEEKLWDSSQILMSCNIYSGAFPISKALELGAQIVIVGRCVDSALVLGPLIYEFKWNNKEFDKLSNGSLAGHLIECGTQCTGGNITDWKLSLANGWDNVGYPILDYYQDNSFTISKPTNTGGLVATNTIIEQLLYEIHDPSMYILPDVICNWSNVKVYQKDTNIVSISGATGSNPTPYYKVAATAFSGFKLSGMLMIAGIDAPAKAIATSNAIIQRTRNIMKQYKYSDYQDVNIEILGADHIYGPNGRNTFTSNEVLARISVRHEDQKALNILANELAPAALSMAPGITGSFDSGRPRPVPVIWYYSCLLPKEHVQLYINIDKEIVYTNDNTVNIDRDNNPSNALSIPNVISTDYSKEYKVLVPLISVCYGRSGDKGDTCNIGIVARKPEYYSYLIQILTEDTVLKHMNHLVKGSVKRYFIPSLHAFNFVLSNSLGGGGVSSLNMDRQGKTYAQILLSMKIYVPCSWFPNLTANY